MKSETTHTIELTPKDVKKIILDKFQTEFPEKNFDNVSFNIASDPTDDCYGGGYPSQILTSVKVEGKTNN